MFQNVIFDLDGTLLNTIDDLADAANWVCARHGWPLHTVEEYKRFVGNGIPRLVERFAPAPERTPEGLAPGPGGVLGALWRPQGGQDRPLCRDAGGGGAAEGGGGADGGAVQQGPRAGGPGGGGLLPGAVPLGAGGPARLPTKPDPTLLHRLMEQMGASPEDTLFVGDSDVDIRTARNGGLTSCGVLWGFRGRAELEAEGADCLARTPEELVKAVWEMAETILETDRLILREMTDRDFRPVPDASGSVSNVRL